MITTDNEDIYQRSTVFRDQGKAGFYGNVHTELGYNWRMSEIHAAIGLSQFLRLEEFIADRRKAAGIYDRGLAKIGGLKPVPMPPATKTNYYKYIALLDKDIDRPSLKKKMKEKYNVSLSGEVYELPCHLQPVMKNLYGYKGGEFPAAEDICHRHICLPVYARMTAAEANYVVDCLREVLR
jgi:dTDP-4-amino-4,6-dideoxygalactose transaminase